MPKTPRAGGEMSQSQPEHRNVASYQISAPEPFDVNKPEQWPAWIKRFERFRCATKMQQSDGATQVNTLIYLMGPSAEEILKSFSLSEEEVDDFEKVVERFEKHFVVRRNGTYERAKFLQRMQGENESVDCFITALYSLSEYCEYGDLRETMICDKVIHGLRDAKLAEQLQLDVDLTLQKAVNKARQSEAVKKQQATVRSSVPVSLQEIDRVIKQRNQEKKINYQKKEGERCKQCYKIKNSYKHDCPAKNAICNKCGYKGHYAVCCKTKEKKIKMITEGQTEDEFLGSIQAVTETGKSNWNAVIKVCGEPVRFKIDTGADVTVISKHLAEKLKLKLEPNPTKRLTGPANQKLTVVGQCKVKMEIEDRSSVQTIYVLDQLKQPLLGSPAIDDLKIIKRLCSVTQDIKQQYPKLFKGLGLMRGEYTIKLTPNAVPFALSTPRRIAIPLREKVKTELETMEEQGVIRKIDEPTEWCSGMVVVPKKNGEVRICVDLIPLNKAVMREFYVLPSVDESLAQLAGSKYFSKLDAKSGFWQVKLATECQPLTTFITPFGRYCFQRLPFGISSAPEHYQKRMSQILTGLDGVICHADDILIYGKSKSEHDERLCTVLETLQNEGVTLNEKCIFEVEEVKFLGHIINKSGIQPDPEKLSAISTMDAPSNITELRRFNGMVQYVAKFVPQLSTITQPLRELLKQDNQWTWGYKQEESFNKVKSILTSEPILAKYDANKPTRVAADASAYGIGGVMEQLNENQWKPVIYISRSLTKTEMMYAQVEKECLAILWACEKLREYITGKEFEVLTDHQPLITVLGKKNLDELTPRLQRMKMKLMGYSFKIRHVPGKYLYTADLMSRIPKSEKNKENALSEEIERYVNSINLKELPISDKQLERIKLEQQKDETLKRVIEAVKYGWEDIPESLLPYFREKEDLTVHQGILIKNQRLVIPKSMRKEILEKIHAGHLGISKCRERARETVWWPNISGQIKTIIKGCEICCEQRVNKSETLITSELPDRPWQMVGMDLFKLEGRMYLLIMDYYSKYLEVLYVEKTTAAYIISKIKATFARFGIPEIVRADNGTQFIAEELNIFKNEYGFEIITNSPKHSQSNGQAEAGVKIAKNILKKNKDPNLGFLEYRNTPCVNNHCPAELMFGRKLRTPLPRLPQLLRPKMINPELYREIQDRRKKSQAHYFDRRHDARDLTPLRQGERVWVADLRRWGKVEKENSIPRSYIISTNKRSICRNRKYLIPCSSEPENPELANNQPAEDIKEDNQEGEKSEPIVRKKQELPPSGEPKPEPIVGKNQELPPSGEPKQSAEPLIRRSSRQSRPPSKLNL